MAVQGKGSPPKKKVWYKDPMVLGVAGIGGIAGLYVLAKNKGKAGTGQGQDLGLSSTGAIPGAPYSSLGTDFYNAIQDSTGALQDKLFGLQQSVQDVNLQISKLPVQNTVPTNAQPGYTTRRSVIWQGTRLRPGETLTQLANRVSISQTKTGRYSTLKALIQRNPALYARYGSKRPASGIALIPVQR